MPLRCGQIYAQDARLPSRPHCLLKTIVKTKNARMKNAIKGIANLVSMVWNVNLTTKVNMNSGMGKYLRQ